MISKVYQRERARRDLVEHFVYHPPFPLPRRRSGVHQCLVKLSRQLPFDRALSHFGEYDSLRLGPELTLTIQSLWETLSKCGGPAISSKPAQPVPRTNASVCCETLHRFQRPIITDSQSIGLSFCDAMRHSVAHPFLLTHGKPTMIPDDIVDAFSSRTFPADAIAACRTEKESTSLILLKLMEDFVKGYVDIDPDESERAKNAFFLTIHLLAEFKEKRAFPLLMRFLVDDKDWVEEVLGDAITHTLPDILISTFDGNLDALHQIITDAAANEYARSSALEALAYLTTVGMIPGESTQQFLQECFDTFRNEPPCFVWIGWVECIAALGMEALVPLVEQAFRVGSINATIMNFSHFQNDLQRTLRLQAQHMPGYTRKDLFNNVDDLASWIRYAPESEYLLSPTDGSMELIRNLSKIPQQFQPHTNPHRNVGRNDPCPCGSGKKFKKCCL